MNNSNSKKMATNTIWNAVENFSQLGIQMVCTFILARFLTPSDFGILGMLVVFTQIARTITDSGFGVALIREKEVTVADSSSIFYVNVLVSIILYIFLYACSGMIADFYHQPILKEMCKFTFIVVPIFGLQVVHRAIMIRNMQFKEQGLMSLAAALISSIVAIILAYYWRNVWALVVQNILMTFLNTLFYWTFSKWHPHLIFSLISVKKYFYFSKNLLFSSLIGNIFNNLNALLIGHYYTATDLGLYNQANRINLIASSQPANIIKNVSFPILSNVNNQSGDIKDAYRKVLTVTMLLVSSLMVLLMGIAQDLFELLMGSLEWRLAGTYFFILGFAGILRPWHIINESILQVIGQSKKILYLEILRRVTMILILFITVNFDVIYFVLGYTLYSFIELFLNMYFCGKTIDYSTKKQLTDIMPILFKQLGIIVVSLIINYVLSNNSIYVRLVAVTSAQLALIYILFHKTKTFLTIIDLTKKVLKK